MGGGVSLLSDIAKQLPPHVLTQFTQYQKECLDKGLSPEETMNFLTQKYEDYMELELKERGSGQILTEQLLNSTFSAEACDEEGKKEEVFSAVVLNFVTITQDFQATDEKSCFECTLCKTKFESLLLLHTHNQFSEHHAENMKKLEAEKLNKERQKIYSTDVDLSTIDKLQKGFRKRAKLYKKLNLNQLRWFKAVHKVIALRYKKFYQQRMNLMVFIPKTVQLLHAGHKLFYRHSGSVTVDIRMYFHTLCHCIEIVPNLLYITHTKSRANSPMNDHSASDHTDTDNDHFHMPAAAAVTYFISLPRIYLDYNAVLGGLESYFIS